MRATLKNPFRSIVGFCLTEADRERAAYFGVAYVGPPDWL